MQVQVRGSCEAKKERAAPKVQRGRRATRDEGEGERGDIKSGIDHEKPGECGTRAIACCVWECKRCTVDASRRVRQAGSRTMLHARE